MSDFCTCDEFAMDDREDSFGFLSTDAPFPIPVDLGGTGADNAAGARANLGLGTAAVADLDDTLTVSGAAADAKATGSSVLSDTNNIDVWTRGAISSSTGENSNSTTRLRTVLYLKPDIKTISVSDGYKFMLFAYDDSDAFIGVWNGESFVKAGNWLRAPISLVPLPSYNFKLVLAEENNSTINVSAYANCLLLASVAGIVDRIKAALFVANLDTSMVTRLPTQELTDLDDVTTPGTYSVINSTAASGISNLPINAPGKLYVLSNTLAGRTLQIYIAASGGNVFFRSNYPTLGGWRLVDDSLRRPLDGSAADSLIEQYVTRKNVIKLAAGTFKVHSLEIPADVMIEGEGDRTILQLDPDFPNDPVLILNHGSKVRNLKIIGSGGESYDASSGSVIGTSHGIQVANISGTDLTNRLRIVIEGVEIAGFTGAGIYLYNTGVNIGDNVAVSNCNVHNCNAGIYTKLSEYHRISNSSFNGCYYGAYNDGGNNVFSNCGFNGCQIGAYLENIDGTAKNNSHGTFSACTFNHEHDVSIKIEAAGSNYVSSGEVFVGCHIAYGSVEITNGTAINFTACNFLSSTPITVGGGGLTLFNGCIFISSTQTPVTKTGEGTLLFRECYTRSGAAFNPI